jgi:hypothetical protein
LVSVARKFRRFKGPLIVVSNKPLVEGVLSQVREAWEDVNIHFVQWRNDSDDGLLEDMLRKLLNAPIP